MAQQSQQSQSNVRNRRRSVKTQEDIQKIQRHNRNVLRKEQRDVQRDKNRNLSDFSFESLSTSEEFPLENTFQQLRSHCSRSNISGDEIDFGGSNSINLSAENEIAVKCLKLIQERLTDENPVSWSVSDIYKPYISSYSALVDSMIINSRLGYIVSLLNKELICSYDPSNKSLLKEIVNTIYLIIVMVKTDHQKLQLITETQLHTPFLLVLGNDGFMLDIEMCMKIFVCLTLLTEKNDGLRLFLIQNGYSTLMLKHSQNALSTPRNNEDILLNYVQALSWSLSSICTKLGDRVADAHFMSQTLMCVHNLMQLNDDFVIMNVFWILSALIVPGSLCNKEFIETSGLIPKLCTDLDDRSRSESLKEAAITTLANITAYSEALATAVYSCDVMRYDFVEKLFNSNSAILQYQMIIVLNNIINVVPPAMNKATKSGVCGLLMDMLLMGDYKSQREVTYLIRNIVVNGSPEDVMELLKNDVIKNLSVQINITEPDLILTALNIYERLLFLEKNGGIVFDVAHKCEQYGILDKMEPHCYHPNHTIVETVYRIYDEYFANSDSGENFDESVNSNKSFNF
ncbi:importin subunit alpha-1-like protein [Leptotrombidium deliense]|uniref:Importin subunit alpha-1-like protein n=1 Tax=Leptotrombidium deliense TaxID=299467 RepID=A0A443STY6_9ACAR|nr:importin subunit alpha-1-like protein [Leptotrombidium deliense]